MQLHLSAITFKRKRTTRKGDDWENGVAVIEAPGLSNVLLCIDSKGKTVVPYDYHLSPSTFAASVEV